jgi:hypothetical protein
MTVFTFLGRLLLGAASALWPLVWIILFPVWCLYLAGGGVPPACYLSEHRWFVRLRANSARRRKSLPINRSSRGKCK